MPFQIIGLNHKTAPLTVREKLAFSESECARVLPLLVDGETIDEAILISTCNRVEVLLKNEAETGAAATARVVECFAEAKNIAPAEFVEYLYNFSDEAAAQHLFRVAASLDSLVVGEAQILGQVRRAYSVAVEAGTARRSLHKLMHHAFAVAKRVRAETGIARNAASVASAAVELACKTFGSLADKTVLLVGAGEMARLAAKHFAVKGANRLLVVNRTAARAAALAIDFDAEIFDFERLDDALALADIVVCSTGSPDFLINFDRARRAQTIRGENPALYLDLSVPRNIEPPVKTIENVSLADVDDLEAVVACEIENKGREAARAEQIVSEETGRFWQSLHLLDRGAAIGQLRAKMQSTALAELERQRHRLGNLTPEQESAVESLILAAVNKIAHPVLYGLRRSHETGASEFAEILCALLGETSSEIQNSKFKIQDSE